MYQVQGEIDELISETSGEHTSDKNIKRIANRLKLSLEAVVIRLVECGYAPQNFWRIWKARSISKGYLPSEDFTSGGAGNVDIGKTKLAYLGFLFGRIVPDGYAKHGLTKMAVFQASRLKPKYMLNLAEATKSGLKEVESYATSS